MPDPGAGDLVGEYTLEQPLDEGGQGYIWRARNAGSGALVALKLLTKPNSQSEVGLMRREIEVLAATAANRSPHIVRVLGGAAEPVPHIVMEFVDGTDLRRELQRLDQLHGGALGRFSQLDAVLAGLGVADALAALHSEGIIHRDVKPANVMMDRRGNIKLTDFGIAKIIGTSAVTVASEQPLSLHYAAPEVWDGQAVAKSDIYALGVTLFELLSGKPPFQGTTTGLYRQHLSQPPGLEALPPDTTPALLSLIGRCLAKAPDDRPSAAECRDVLMQLRNELLQQAETAPLQSREPEYLGPWLRLTPHPGIAWAWYCRHRDSGEQAVVELHFAHDLRTLEDQIGDARRALDLNARLLPLGAERLLAVDRFLLGPGEAWSQTPPGRFSYFVARAEQPLAESPPRISSQLLLATARSLAALLAAARREGLLLNLSPEQLSLDAEGRIHLRRPGLNAQDGPSMDAAALGFLRGLPLDAGARAELDRAVSVEDLIARQMPAGSATVLVERNQTSDTVLSRPAETYATQIVGPPARHADPSSPDAEYASFDAELRPLKAGTRFAPASFELLLRNNADEEQRVRFRTSSGDIQATIPDAVTLGPGTARTIPFTVQARKARMFGGAVERGFELSASGDLGGPIETYRGTFRDESKPWLPLGAAALLAVVVAVVVLSRGGSGTASEATARNHLEAFNFKAALADFDEAINRNANDASLYAGRARAHFNLAAFAPALSDATKASQLDAANAEAHYVQSLVHNQLWHYEDAVAAVSKAIELAPDNALYYATRSQIYGEREAAKQLQDATRALELDENDAQAHAAMASVYNTQRKFTEADAEYVRAIALQPKEGLLYVSRAMVHYHTDDYEGALRRLDEDQQVISAYPLANLEGLMARGINHYGAGRYPEAIAQFNKANEIFEDWSAYYYWHGLTYYNQSDYTTALRDFARASELSPTEPAIYLARGLVNRDQDRLDAAAGDMSRAISLNPTSGFYHSQRGYVFYLQDNYEAAAADCTRALELDPSLYFAHHVRSLVRVEQGRYGDALLDANRAIELRANDADLLSNRGYVYYRLDNYPAALADLSASLSIEPEGAYTYNRRGNVHYIMGNYQQAVDDYSKAIQHNGGDAQFYLNRGSAFENLRRINEARADYERARSLASTPQQRQDAQDALDDLR